MDADITNALIRCTRDDRVAHPAFELVREDLDVWVRELPENFDGIIGDLSVIRNLLKALRIGSSDYTLCLGATIDEIHSLSLPPELAELAGDCGFALEVISSPA